MVLKQLHGMIKTITLTDIFGAKVVARRQGLAIVIIQKKKIRAQMGI